MLIDGTKQLFRDGRLPTDQEDFVRSVEVTVLLADRRAVEVLRVGDFVATWGLADQELIDTAVVLRDDAARDA